MVIEWRCSRMQTINERLREIRKSKNISQRKLGELAGMPQQAIAKYETGKVNPKLTSLKRIANALDVKLEDLLIGTNWTEVEKPKSYNSGAEFEKARRDLLQHLQRVGAKERAISRKIGGEIASFTEKTIPGEQSIAYKNALNFAFDKLNLDGQKIAVDQVELLTEIPKYQKGSDSECPASQNAETPTGSESATDATPPENK